jgi:hypothetical protein
MVRLDGPGPADGATFGSLNDDLLQAHFDRTSIAASAKKNSNATSASSLLSAKVAKLRKARDRKGPGAGTHVGEDSNSDAGSFTWCCVDTSTHSAVEIPQRQLWWNLGCCACVCACGNKGTS